MKERSLVPLEHIIQLGKKRHSVPKSEGRIGNGRKRGLEWSAEGITCTKAQ